MLDENKARVESYISNKNQTILYFDDEHQRRFNQASIMTDYRLDVMILHMLLNTRDSDSYTKPASERDTPSLETTKYRNRSVLDIWRHIKSLRSSYSIIDVMHELRGLTVANKLSSLVCHNIGRRVFLFNIVQNSYDTDDIERDEFGLKLSEWE